MYNNLGVASYMKSYKLSKIIYQNAFLGFNETYDNLSYKTLSIMYWVHHRVTNGRFKPKWIFKCDDDNLVNIYKLEKYLKSIEEQNSKRIYCYVRDDAIPIRQWFLNLKLKLPFHY